MKTSQSLSASKDRSKFWSSQTWRHFLTHAKHFEGECIPYYHQESFSIWIVNLKTYCKDHKNSTTLSHLNAYIESFHFHAAGGELAHAWRKIATHSRKWHISSSFFNTHHTVQKNLPQSNSQVSREIWNGNRNKSRYRKKSLKRKS